MSDQKQTQLIQQLIEERNRDGEEPFTTEELLRTFKQIRDAASIAIKQCLNYNPKGLKTAQDIYKFSRHEIKVLEIELGVVCGDSDGGGDGDGDGDGDDE